MSLDKGGGKLDRRRSWSAAIRERWKGVTSGMGFKSKPSSVQSSRTSLEQVASSRNESNGLGGWPEDDDVTKRYERSSISSPPPPITVFPAPLAPANGLHKSRLSAVSETSADGERAGTLMPLSKGETEQEIAHGPGQEPARPDNVVVPQLLQLGTPMTKVSAKKHKKFVFRLDPDLGHIVWESKKVKIIPIENIKEIRTGASASSYLSQFQLSQSYESRWITLIYVLDGRYKTLHLIAATRGVFRMWESTLRGLLAIRRELMSGLGNLELREAMWEKVQWKGADEREGQRLSFEEVEKLCRKLNVNSSTEDLGRLFEQADTHNHGYLDFDDFRRFVKLLKSRPDVQRIYEGLISHHSRGTFSNDGVFDVAVFKKFMREDQVSELDDQALDALFCKYSGGEPTLTVDGFTRFLMSVDNSPFHDSSVVRVCQDSVTEQDNGMPRPYRHDMTQPLPSYFIASSHNTYLVGHQLVGESTVEGYVRALLGACRSVEVDIYPGSTEPVIFHGRTLTSPVSLREVCEAIKKYGFIASPYPIIISAEVHCGLVDQDKIAKVLIEVFGDMLIRKDLVDMLEEWEGKGIKVIEKLPSPEDLRGKILFKTKDLSLTNREKRDIADERSSSSTTATATDWDTSAASASEAEFYDPTGVTYEVPGARGRPGVAMGKAGTEAMTAGDVVPKEGQYAILPESQPASNVEKEKETQTERKRLSRGNSLAKAGMGVLGRVRGFTTRGMSAPVLPSAPQGDPQVAEPEASSGTPRKSSFSLARPPTPTTASRTPLSKAKTDPLLSPTVRTATTTSKVKFSPALATLLVYTVGVKFRGLNKKEVYAVEHMFSLSEVVMEKILGDNALSQRLSDNSKKSSNHKGAESKGEVGDSAKGGRENLESMKGGIMWDLIKHARTHLVRTYPKGWRLRSTNHEPHRFWAAGCQLVALNWQTYDLGYTINHAMFQRNGRCGYVLKPLALRIPSKDLLLTRTKHILKVTVISAQQLPRPKNALGHEIEGRLSPYVEVEALVPDWPCGGSQPAQDPLGGPRNGPTRAGEGAENVWMDSPSGSGVFSAGKGKEKVQEERRGVVDGSSPRTKKRRSLTSLRPAYGVEDRTHDDAFLSPPQHKSHSLPLPYSTSTPSRTPSVKSARANKSTSRKTLLAKTSVVKKNGFNPVWEETLWLPFDCVGVRRSDHPGLHPKELKEEEHLKEGSPRDGELVDVGGMTDLIFVRFAVKCEDRDDESVAVYCASLGSLGRGYRHLPLHDSQLSQFLFSTLFVKIEVLDVEEDP